MLQRVVVVDDVSGWDMIEMVLTKNRLYELLKFAVIKIYRAARI